MGCLLLATGFQLDLIVDEVCEGAIVSIAVGILAPHISHLQLLFAFCDIFVALLGILDGKLVSMSGCLRGGFYLPLDPQLRPLGAPDAGLRRGAAGNRLWAVEIFRITIFNVFGTFEFSEAREGKRQLANKQIQVDGFLVLEALGQELLFELLKELSNEVMGAFAGLGDLSHTQRGKISPLHHMHRDVRQVTVVELLQFKFTEQSVTFSTEGEDEGLASTVGPLRPSLILVKCADQLSIDNPSFLALILNAFGELGPDQMAQFLGFEGLGSFVGAAAQARLLSSLICIKSLQVPLLSVPDVIESPELVSKGVFWVQKCGNRCLLAVALPPIVPTLNW